MYCSRVVVLAAVPSLIASSFSAAAEKEGSKTPEGAAKQFVQALKDADQAAYRAVVKSGTAADGVLEFALAGESFKRKIIKAYGEVGWGKFQDSNGARINLGFQEMKLADMKFDVKGDTATASLPDEKDVLHLGRKGEQWFVDLDATIAGQDKNGSMTGETLGKALKSMAKTIREYEKKIGGDTTVDQLDKEMGAAFLAALVEAGAQPKISVQVK